VTDLPSFPRFADLFLPTGVPLAGAVAGRRRGDLQVVCEAPWREPTRQADLSPKDPCRVALTMSTGAASVITSKEIDSK
jgi:hypothetical protein